MKKILKFLLLIGTLAVFFSPIPASAQTQPELSLRLSKDFGYSSGTGSIQGTFSLRASGPDTVRRVVFYLDNQKLGEVAQPPFNLRFNTGDYSLGTHSLSAVGYTTDGRELKSNTIQGNFISGEQATQNTMKIVVPILVLVLLAALLSAIVPALGFRGKKENLPAGAPRNYGALGGAICPACGRPYARHIWGINLVAGKLDRCPYCGAWRIVRRASPAALRAAELAEIEDAREGEFTASISEEEKLRRELEESKYQNL